MLQNCAGRRTQNRIFDPLAGCAWIAWRRRRDVAGLITVYDRMTTCGQGAFYERSPKLFTRGSAEAARYPRLNVTAQFLLIRVIRGGSGDSAERQRNRKKLARLVHIITGEKEKS